MLGTYDGHDDIACRPQTAGLREWVITQGLIAG